MYQDFFNKDDGYLDDFRQKVAEQKIATMEERRNELARSRNNFLGTFAGIALAGVVGWFILAPQYKQSTEDIPVIRRPQSAVKIKPENPGGMEIPNQDKDVYNIVEKKDVDTTVVENLLPTPEQPKLPDIVPEEIAVNENAQNLDEIVEEVEASETETVEVSIEQTTSVPSKPNDLLADSSKVQSAEKTGDNALEKEKKTEIVTTGGWQIQLIASKNKDAIEKTWNNLTAKYKMLKAYNHELQEADLGSQGMIYKLRAGSFASKEEAQNVCSELKKQGLTDCIAKER